jgi:hypothetical protein
MSVSGHPRAAAAAVLLAVLPASTPAMADMTKDECIDANAKAQDLRREGKLSSAKEQLTKCIDPSCPALVRSDCTKRLDDLANAQPTIAFEAKDTSDADVVLVNVKMDGKPLTDKLDGTALAVDPGQHVFTFEAVGRPPVTRTLVVTEGEKGRRERIVLGAPPATVSPTLATPPSSAGAPASLGSNGGGMGTQRILGLVAGGVGLAGIAVGGVFGAMTLSKKSQQEAACGASCSPSGHAQALSDHSAGITDSAIATVGFIAGGALLVGGVVMFVTSPSSPRPAEIGILPSVGPGGGGILVRGSF